MNRPRRLQGFGTTIFTEMTALAQQHQAVNLGQGFPDFDGPEAVREAAVAALRAGRNQYARMAGVLELAAAVAHHQRRFYDLAYDPETEVTVTSGATEAIFDALVALTMPGDEVVLFAPFYDSYRAAVAMAGATARVVALAPPQFACSPAELEAAIGPRTRLVLLNTPHNPTGKVWSRAELEHLAALARERDLVVVSDEVYEHLVFAGEHLPIATLPGMRERTVTISSTGKTYGFTGWKIGYACAPAELSRALRSAHQFVTFATATPLQWAMAEALRSPDAYYRELLEAYRERRQHLMRGLAGAGFGVLPPAGAYFVLADPGPLGLHGVEDGAHFCRQLPALVGVAAVPASAFYDADAIPEAARPLLRFAFCKRLATLDEGVRRLQSLRSTPPALAAP
jgi:N-succinyldiaminopimelate aminotransferase